ncbi:MAG: hypothetical protein ACOH2R_17275 [Pseudomonas sp.]
MSKKIKALVWFLGLSQLGAIPLAIAEPASQPPFNINLSCLRHNGTIYPGMVAAGQTKVIHGPYTSKCGNVTHIFQLGALQVIVEQLRNGNWTPVTAERFDINDRLGSGTFRVVLDNSKFPFARSYRGTFSVPL